ncbi:MAG: hypothetical protein LBQ52_06675 [Helicobacteraceae bacterium]|nr:hypothetical protein [Helicobacteraceae bacterium]
MTETPRNLFVNPRDLLAIVPYWTIKEAEECAKIIWAFTKIRVQNGSDRAYGASDFRSLAFEGILVAKQKYEKDGEKLRVEQCRGYIQSYTNEETRKKQRSNKLDVMHSGRNNLVYDKDDVALEKPDEGSDNTEYNAIIEYIKYNYSCVLTFARAYFDQDGDRRILQKTFGANYNSYKRQFITALKAFKEQSK